MFWIHFIKYPRITVYLSLIKWVIRNLRMTLQQERYHFVSKNHHHLYVFNNSYPYYDKTPNTLLVLGLRGVPCAKYGPKFWLLIIIGDTKEVKKPECSFHMWWKKPVIFTIIRLVSNRSIPNLLCTGNMSMTMC